MKYLVLPLLLTGWMGWQVFADNADNKKPTFNKQELSFYEKDVLPILKEHCYKCHGDGKSKGGLSLMTRKSILEGGDLGPAFQTDKPEASNLLKAIHYQDGLDMPPSGKLPQAKIDVLAKWIKTGLPMIDGQAAPEKKHEEEGGKVTPESRNYWAYKSIQRPAIPTVQNKSWVHNPIDAFVLAKLEEKGLKPSPKADRLALVRRVYFDLIGLPPTPEEIDAFINDSSPDAYEKLIDKLLASSHYGEKWGRHWLDLVRYAETHGYERDNPKPYAWRYRDYVIQAFNQDKPYDRFLLEQLAGDELNPKDQECLTATGYYRLGIWDDEPADPLLAKYDVLDGIVSTTSQVFLGMTINCARCHDHKKDPIPQRDYYRLLAFFRDVTPMNTNNIRHLMTDAQKAEWEQKKKAKQVAEGEWYRDIYRIQQQFLTELKEKKNIRIAAESDLTELTYKFYRDTWDEMPDFDQLKFEDSGKIASNFFTLAPASRQEAMGMVFEGKLKVPQKGEYTFHIQAQEGVRLKIDNKLIANYPTKGDHLFDAKASLEAGLLPIRLEYFNVYRPNVLKVSWSGSGIDHRALSELPVAPKKAQNSLNEMMTKHAEELLGKATYDDYKKLVQKLDGSRKTKLPEPGVEIMAVEELGRAKTNVLIRGNPTSPGEQVEAGFPEVLANRDPAPIKLNDSSALTSGKRLALAQWLVDKSNPLTARVLANRLWHYHFGKGIVPSTNDFGKLGDQPTHPDLLDWLAYEVVSGEWKLKRMHKLILLSNTYQQTAKANPEGLKLDPANNLWGRFNMRRLLAEEVRDTMLCVSGKLNKKANGPSIYPPIPKEVLAGQSVPGKGWNTSSAEESTRRSVYVHVKRSLQLPILAQHDQADTDSSCPVRYTTTVPTQALGMLNGEFTNEMATALAERLKKEAPNSITEQIRRAIRLSTGRQPTDEEVKKDHAFVQTLQEKANGNSQTALRQYCLMILNTNELVYLD